MRTSSGCLTTIPRAWCGVALSVALLSACGNDSSAPNPIPPDTRGATPLAPLALARAGTPIPDRYIVVFKPEVQDAPGEARRQVTAGHGRLHFTYTHAIKGYAATLSPAALDAVRRAPAVKYVEQDQTAHGSGTETPAPSWGLDRIDQRDLPLSNSYTYAPTGSGIRVYILDSGIRLSHHDFGGRAISGQDYIGDGKGTDDCVGHGTHVAGTVAGTTYGVAKGAVVVAVRVLGCDNTGFYSGIIAGVNWVTADGYRPAVANMSLGGPYSQALNDAVTASINSGVVYAIAAMNNNADACSGSPASTPAALTVAAADIGDARASFSNYGSCVDLFGPGVGITSDWNTGDDATASLSGTSMATPHVAGTAALYFEQHPSASPAQAAQAIVDNASAGKVADPGTGTPNKLLYMGFLNAASGRWATRAAMPTARKELAVGTATGVVYAIGGQNSAGIVLAKVEAYNPATNSWSTKAPVPAARWRTNGTATVNGVIYLAGGVDGTKPGHKKTLYAYSAATNRWSTKAPMPVAGGCGGSGAINGIVFVLIGCDSLTSPTAGAKGVLMRYAPAANTWSTKAPSPTPHQFPAVGVVGGKFYVIGGKNGSGTATTTVHVYSPSTNTWTTKAPLPSARYRATAQAVAGKLYVVGGNDAANAYSNTVYVYDPSTNAWSSTATMPTGRANLGSGVVKNVFYGVGGQSSSSAALTSNEALTP
jgi:subtilisin family serine protease